MGLRVAVANNKGGSGKTAATRNLAAALAELGKRVLVVDMDPQANASRRLGAKFNPEEPTPTTAEVISDRRRGIAASAIRPSGWPPPYGGEGGLVDVIPSRFDLENRISEAGVVGAVLRLDRAMDGADDDYDVTLFDCPPSLGHLTQLALAASHGAVCILEPEYDGLDGAIRLRDFVADEDNRKALSNPDLTVFGYVVNRLRKNLGAHNVQLDALPVIFGADRVWKPQIPERAAEKDASDSELPLRLVGSAEGKKQAVLWVDHAEKLIKIMGDAE